MKIVKLYEEKAKWVFDWKLLSLWITSLIILLMSYQKQHIEDIEPCKLCKWQQIAYFLIILIAPFGFFRTFNLPIRFCLIYLFIIGFFIATYHALVQYGWTADRCAMTNKVETIEDFVNMLDLPKKSCSAISWKIFGFSASIYNTIFSLFAIFLLSINTFQKAFHDTKFCSQEENTYKKTTDRFDS